MKHTDSGAGLQTFLSQQKPVAAVTSAIIQEVKIALALQPQSAEYSAGVFLAQLPVSWHLL